MRDRRHILYNAMLPSHLYTHYIIYLLLKYQLNANCPVSI